MERYEIVVDDEGNYCGLIPSENGPLVQYADAQATIAALQARVQDLEQWVQDQSTANLETMRHMDEMQSRAMDAEQQLTQRTAELERVRLLIKALPKVEGEVTVRDVTALYWTSDGTYGSIDCKEQLVSLLKHRQGMEG